MTSPHKYYNQCKGIVYLRECDVTDIAEVKNGLKSKYNIADVTIADFIKTNNDYTTPLLLTFNNDSLPETLHIPGEKADTIVYPFIN